MEKEKEIKYLHLLSGNNSTRHINRKLWSSTLTFDCLVVPNNMGISQMKLEKVPVVVTNTQKTQEGGLPA